MDLVTVIILFMFGAGVGTLGTLVGIGGGWFHVPFLIWIFNFTPQDAVGTSISIIFLNTMAGAFIYSTQNKVDFNYAWKLGVAVIPGAIVGPIVVQNYTPHSFSFIFSIFLFLLAYYLVFMRQKFFGNEETNKDRPVNVDFLEVSADDVKSKVEIGIIGSFVIGFISNLIGIGGGVIHVPFLILVLRFPTHIAVATAHFILFISSAIGTLVFTLFGNVHIDYMMSIGIGSIFGAMLGSRLSAKSSEDSIRQILAGVVTVVAVYMILSVLL